jgi:2-polyprenyl-3-methyl-5-hydroxy-6-metoxy-1,4-benzoquinol methylase
MIEAGKHLYWSFNQSSSFYTQVKLVLDAKPKNVLLVGVGDNVVPSILRQYGLSVTTLDLDKELKSDIVASVESIPCGNNEFDVIICCEVLEHLPLSSLDSALSELKRVCNDTLIISVPNRGYYLQLAFRLNLPTRFMYDMLGMKVFHFFIHIPAISKFVKDPEGGHQWELNAGIMPNKFRHKIKEGGWRVVSEPRPIVNAWHHFFVVRKESST